MKPHDNTQSLPETAAGAGVLLTILVALVILLPYFIGGVLENLFGLG